MLQCVEFYLYVTCKIYLFVSAVRVLRNVQYVQNAHFFETKMKFKILFLAGVNPSNDSAQ